MSGLFLPLELCLWIKGIYRLVKSCLEEYRKQLYTFKKSISNILILAPLGKDWYNLGMYNWSVDEVVFKKNHPKQYRLWKLEQLINYGLGKEKLKKSEVKSNIDKLDIDPLKKKYLNFLLS